MYDDDFDSDGEWGYNGDTEHDMWVDYTTDIYDDTDYSGEYGDYDIHDDHHYGEPHHHGASAMPKKCELTVQQCEQRIDRLEALIAASLAAASLLETKSVNATAPKNIRKYQLRTIEKQNEIRKYQRDLDKLKRKHERLTAEEEKTRTKHTVTICAIIAIFAILIALLY